jgi:hypothetical protein
MPHLSRLNRIVSLFTDRYIEGTVTGISVLGGATNYNGALNGLSGSQFVPTHAIVTCTAAGGALNGDAQIQIGTTNGGAELMAAFPLTGVTGVGTKHLVQFTGAIPALVGNATLYVRMTSADGSGNTGTVKVDFFGNQV